MDDGWDPPRGISWGDLVVVEPATSGAPAVDDAQSDVPPLHCRLRLWHTWCRQQVPGGGSYVACGGCGRQMPETLFERSWE